MSALRLTRIEAVGALVSLWGRALEEAPDGCLIDWSTDDIARAMGLEATEGRTGPPPIDVAAALVASGYAEMVGGNLVLHDWMSYQGNLKEAKRKAEWRAGRDRSGPSRDTMGRERDTTGHSQDSRARADVTRRDVDSKHMASADAEPALVMTSPETNGKKELDPAAEWMTGFEEFYGVYPRKVKKPAAQKAYRAKRPVGNQQARDDRFSEIIEGRDRWIRFWRDQQTPIDKVPYPATFLNGDQFMDTPS